MADTPSGALGGKVAIVTGASRGIGEAIAKAYAAEGAKVVIASRKLAVLEAVAEAIRSAGGDALPVACHTGKPDEVEALVAQAVEAYDQVDVLVNNAATNPYFGPMMQLEWPAWDKTFQVNLKGYFAVTREVARHLVDRGAPGSIINNASMLGLTGAPMQGVYGMTKAAVISMTKKLAVELGGSGIRVNAIAPGLVETRFASALINNAAIKDQIMSRTPLNRVGQPGDIAGACVFLGSDASSYVTGHTLVIDGGTTVG